ncbi:MAG: hypothetical protein D6766_07730 [Verrucomicrobia bacterium]|nr:MAG: hypothetical protein D6766_07730 [Verrucomicrobiota bacterium]
MGLKDLFKTPDERRRERARKRRKAFREAENAIEAVKTRIKKLKEERDRAYGEAREYLKEGRKPAAQRALQSVRAVEIIMGRLEQKRWVFEHFLTKLEMAKTDQEFASALQAINTVIEIDPEVVADVLDEVRDRLGEQADVERIWERVHDQELAEASAEGAGDVASIEELMSSLEDEIAAEKEGRVPARTEPGAADGQAEADEVARLRARVRNVIEGKGS